MITSFLYHFKPKLSVMTNSLLRFAIVAFVAITTACNNSTTDTTPTTQSGSSDSATFDLASARTTIDAQNNKFMESIKKGDSSALATLYTQDALVMPSNTEAVPKNKIESMMGSMMKSGVKEIRLTTKDLTGNAEILAETGNFEIYVDGQKMVDKGKYIVVWKPEDGTWKMYRDIFNSDLPPAGSK